MTKRRAEAFAVIVGMLLMLSCTNPDRAADDADTDGTDDPGPGPDVSLIYDEQSALNGLHVSGQSEDDVEAAIEPYDGVIVDTVSVRGRPVYVVAFPGVESLDQRIPIRDGIEADNAVTAEPIVILTLDENG